MTSKATSNIEKIPRYGDQGSPQETNPSTFVSVNDIFLHHQISHLQFAYLNSTWHYQGTTTLFLSYVPSISVESDGISELRFHFRGGSNMKITQVTIATIQPNPEANEDSNNQPIISAIPVLSFNHFDPLAKVLMKPNKTISPIDFDSGILEPSQETTRSSTKRRYEADTQYTRGGQGMMDALRSKAMASNLGEVQITFLRPQLPVEREDAADWTKNVYLCWKKELETTSLEMNGDMNDSKTLSQELKEKLNARSAKRREKRMDCICRTLAQNASTNKGTPITLKVTIQYRCNLITGNTHLGGIHFYTSTSSSNTLHTLPSLQRTPHVNTTSGVLGDHQGTRCWLPTLDSARWNHRCSHEISIAVTANKDEGLWATGFGEDFGLNDVITYPTPYDFTDPIFSALMEVLGSRHVSFITECVKGSGVAHGDSATHSTGLLSCSHLATAVWLSACWNPTPSRSLGFAIGPFNVVYDQEYHNKVDEHEEDENGEKTIKDREKTYKTFQAAFRKGEGVRNLYFADRHDRNRIHKSHSLIRIAEDPTGSTVIIQRSNYSRADFRLFTSLNSTERAIVASTDGIPIRALSLVRGILSLPRFRTSSYTQIWIPLAVDGGCSSGAWNTHPEAICNSFIGGAMFDSSLLNPPNLRLPYYSGGRALQFIQAQAAIKSWTTAAIPLGGDDDIGHSYIHLLFECLLMSLYERAHGAFGEGGSTFSFFYCNRFSKWSGFRSPNIDFFPIYNLEDDAFAINTVHGGTGGTHGEDRNLEHLWRSLHNGTESHTSALDEFSVRQLINKDVLEGFERTDKNLPSMNWLGSHLCTTFLSSNSSSSTSLGCGAVELVHPYGGIAYRYFKCKSIRRIVEGRCGISNFIRVMRAAFIASLLKDLGENKVEPGHLNEKDKMNWIEKDDEMDYKPQQPFLVCVDDLLKEGGITHGLFARCLRLMSGPHRDQYLRGSLIDVSKNIHENNRILPQLEPEGFPNSFIRGCSGLYLRVGAFVESAVTNEPQLPGSTNVAKGTYLHLMAEPVIPNGGIAFGGPITLRVIENEGQVREFLRVIRSDGGRTDWGPVFLHAKPVTTARQQKAASGLIESGSRKNEDEDVNMDNQQNSSQDNVVTVTSTTADTAFDCNQLHIGGYQALELIRLTNRTPLLWVRIDPNGLYDGRYSVFIPDACLGEQLFHDGDAASQVEAARALAERPLKIQGSVNISNVYDVPVTELPVRLLGDCLRGSVALHADLPHNPCIRAQCALAIAQWQNNKAPLSKDAVGANEWIGLNLLIQYFNERFNRDGAIIPAKYTRLAVHGTGHTLLKDGNNGSKAIDSMNVDEYVYIDSLADGFNGRYLLEVEEDEEYRVRSSCLRAIACCRAKDGETPTLVIKFFERILFGNMPSSVKALSLEEEEILKTRVKEHSTDDDLISSKAFSDFLETPYCCSNLIAEALLALCHITAKCAYTEDASTEKRIQSKSLHPCMGLLEASYRWLEWDIYREKIRLGSSALAIGSSCGRNIATCAIAAMSSLAILVQSTSDVSDESPDKPRYMSEITGNESAHILNEATSAQFFADILVSNLFVSDKVSAAAAAALVCIYCASDRLKEAGNEPTGLLSSLEILLSCIHDARVSPGLRQTLATLMMDACTGKICSSHRAAIAGLENDLATSASRFFCGPLGASYGGDNGSAVLLSVSEATAPAANAVNNGARIGLRLLSRAGQNSDISDEIVSRVAIFATSLWRTINGEVGGDALSSTVFTPIVSSDGVCAYDGYLRSSLLSLWQWVWPKGCVAVMRVQSWADHEGTQRYKDLGANLVMKITEEEKEALSVDDGMYNEIRSLVSTELDRQQWRGRMASVAYELYKENEDAVKDATGLNHPLGTIEKDSAWKLGGWVASTAAQRRAAGTDGGTATKIRLIAKPTM